jgi:hypothetical protein
LSKQNVPTSYAKATPKTCVIAEESEDKREMIVSVLDGKIVHEESVRDAEGGLMATHADQVNRRPPEIPKVGSAGSQGSLNSWRPTDRIP